MSNKLARAEKLRDAFETHYREYQYTLVEFLVEHLTDASRVFAGDLQQMLVLALIGQVQIHAARRAVAAGEDPSALPDERVSINASRIADVTGIPRETVRRKLAALERKGWIVRGAGANWRLAFVGGEPTALADLRGIDTRAIARVARLVADLESLAR